MIPYADFPYFGLALIVLVPALLLGMIGRGMREWILVGGGMMLVIQYWGRRTALPGAAVPELWLVLGYAVYEFSLARVFLALQQPRRRFLFYAAVGLGLLPMLLAKYLPLLAPQALFGFLGISYVTFRSLDVVFGIQERQITVLPPGQYFAFLLFFPAISSGPVDRWRRFAEDWHRQRTRTQWLTDLDGFAHRVMTGFLYKFVLAALIKQNWLDPAAQSYGLVGVLSYMYAYSFYLFFDFAGYSAFAIGFGRLFGIHMPENFDRPFLAHNIRDFWNRWHVSLSWWFRDHVYSRFVFAATKGHWFRGRYTASYVGFFFSMGLMGLWHGTAWHYLLYGLYHGSLMAGYEWLNRRNKARRIWGGNGWLSRAGAIVLTFNLVCFGLLIFSGRLF